MHLDYREAHYVKVAARRDIRPRDAFSTRSSGPTTTARSRSAAGPPSTTRSSSTCATGALPVRRRRRRARAVHGAGPGRAAKAARGKRPTDTWWHTIVAHGGLRAHRLSDAEARGRAAAHRLQPPRGPAAGALTSSPAQGRSARSARQLGRRYVLVDSNPQAIAMMRARLHASAVQLSYAARRALISSKRFSQSLWRRLASLMNGE